MARSNRRYRESRSNSVSIKLTDRELEAIDEYCALFNKKSRAAVIREGVIRYVREKIIDRQTCLFPELYGAGVSEPQATYNDTPLPPRLQVADATPSLFEHLDNNLDDDKPTE